MRLLLLLALFALVVASGDKKKQSTRVGSSNEEGYIFAALGAGVKGDAVKLAVAQLMKGEGAKIVLRSVRDNAEKLLDEIYNVTEKLPLPPPRRLQTMQTPELKDILDFLLKFVTPKVNTTRAAVMNVTMQVLDFDHRLRASVDDVQAAVGARELQIRQRHVMQMQELVGSEAAAQLQDATGPKKKFDKSRRKHARNYRQIARCLRRLHRGEIKALHVAGRLLRELQINKIAIVEDRISRFVAQMLDVINKKGKGRKELYKWADKILSDGYILELEESRLMAASGALMGAIAVTTEQTMFKMLTDMLNPNKTSEMQLALDLATGRRNARVFTHRAMVELKTLFSYNGVQEEAIKIERISASEAERMFRTERIFIEGRLDHESYWASNSSDYDLVEQIKRRPKNTKLKYPKRFFLKARERYEKLKEEIERQFDKNGMLWEKNLSHTEATIIVSKKSIRAARALADDVEHLMEGEASYLLAQEHLAVDETPEDRKKALENFAIAKRALQRFVADEPKHYHAGFPGKDNLDDYTEKSEAELRKEYAEALAKAKAEKSKFIMWGKYGHREALRGRIYRQGVAVDREQRYFDKVTRLRLERLKRALKKEKVYFSVATRRRMKGETEGEKDLALLVNKANASLVSPAFVRSKLEDRNGANFFAHYADPLQGVGLTNGFSSDLRRLIRHAQYVVKYGHQTTMKHSKKQMMKSVKEQLKRERGLIKIAAKNMHEARAFIDAMHKAHKKGKVTKKRVKLATGKAWEIARHTVELVQHRLIGATDLSAEALTEVLMGVRAAGRIGVKTAVDGLHKLAKLVPGPLGDRLKVVAKNIQNPYFVSTNSRADRKQKPEDLYSDNRLRNLENFFFEAVPKIRIDFRDAKKTIDRSTDDIEEYFENLPLDRRLDDEKDVHFDKIPF